MADISDSKGRRSIQELIEVEGIDFVPSKYVRAEAERPSFPMNSSTLSGTVSESDEEELPVIKLSALLQTQDLEERSKMLLTLSKACQDWGFFQIENDGAISERVLEIWKATRRFYALPAEERMKYYTEDLGSKVAYMTSFNPSKEKVREWKDSIVFRYIPEDYDEFRDAPHFFRKALIDYLEEMRWLVSQIYSALSESLGLERNLLEEVMDGGKVTLPIHYYPPCPDPSLTLGFSPHSDPNAITLLLQNEVGGLQVARDNGQRWLLLNPSSSTFIVNLGDQMQIVSNGKYKSVEHRVVTNSEKPRMSIGCFFCPPLDTTIAPLPSLLQKDNSSPLYRPTTFREYLQNFNKIGLRSKSGLDFCRTQHASSSS